MLTALRVFLSFFLMLNCASPLVAAGWDQYGDAIQGAAITESFVLSMFFSVNAPLHVISGMMTEKNSVAENAARAAKKHAPADKGTPVSDRVLITSGSNELTSRSGEMFLSPVIGTSCIAAGILFPCQQMTFNAHEMGVFLSCILLFCIILSLTNLPAAFVVNSAIIGTRSMNNRPGFLLEEISC